MNNLKMKITGNTSKLVILFLGSVKPLDAEVKFVPLVDGVLETPWPTSYPVNLKDLEKFHERHCIFTITNFDDLHLVGITQPVLIRRPVITLLEHYNGSSKAFENQWVYAMPLRGKKLNCVEYETEGGGGGGVEDKHYPQRCSQYNFTELASRSKPWGCEVTLDIFPPLVVSSHLKAYGEYLKQKYGFSGTVRYFKYPHIWYRSWREDDDVRLRMRKISPSSVPTIHMFMVTPEGWNNLMSSYWRQEMMEFWIQSMYVRTHYKESLWEYSALNSIFLLVKISSATSSGDRMVSTSVEYMPVPTFVGMAKFKKIQISPDIDPDKAYEAAAKSWTRMWSWRIYYKQLRDIPLVETIENCVDSISGSSRQVLRNLWENSHSQNHATIFMHLWMAAVKNYT